MSDLIKQQMSDARIYGMVDAITAAALHTQDRRELRRAVAEVAVPLLKDREAAHGWMRVRIEHVHQLLMLIDQPPTQVDGKTYVFRNPLAAEVLTKLSAEIRAMLEDRPLEELAQVRKLPAN